MRRKLIAANWKMNGSRAANADWLASFDGSRAPCDVVVCPPFVYLPQVLAGLRGAEAGAQDLSAEAPGAYTGEVAGEMLLDLGVRWVIVGHSERRTLCGESSQVVAAKAARALALGLRPIVCVGETLAEREAGRTLEVIGAQLEAVLTRCAPAQLLAGALAYEPVWAIGTGLTPTSAEIAAAHGFIREKLKTHVGDAADSIRILYGGSVKPVNAAEIMSLPDVDGALVGGAALKSESFGAILAALHAAK